MNKRRISKLMAGMAALLMAIVVVCPVFASAFQTGENNFTMLGVSDDKKHVFDGAGFYSEEEIEKLEKHCKEVSEEFDTDVVIATINGYTDRIEYAVTEIENARYGGANRECANILIIDIGSRDIRVESIEGSKSNDNWMKDGLCNYIYEEIAPSFSSNKYYKGTEKYLDLLDKYLPASAGYNPDSIIYNPLAHLAVAVIISAIIVASQVAGAGGKVTVSEKDFLQLGGDHRVDRRDIFLRKTVTKTRMSSSSGGGRSGGGGGGGGRGGGGGKF